MGSPEPQCINVGLPTQQSPSSTPVAPETPEPSEPGGPADERFVYGLTAKGRAYLGDLRRARVQRDEGGLDRRERRRRRARRARAAGRRFGTVCGRFREGGRVPDLRLSGKWLRATGFDLGQEFEIEVQEGRLVIQAV